MAVFNGEKYLTEQIASILSQLGPNEELVIINNGSTDTSISILHDFHDSKIKIYRTSSLDSTKANFINALSHASGNLIFLADQRYMTA